MKLTSRTLAALRLRGIVPQNLVTEEQKESTAKVENSQKIAKTLRQDYRVKSNKGDGK